MIERQFQLDIVSVLFLMSFWCSVCETCIKRPLNVRLIKWWWRQTPIAAFVCDLGEHLKQEYWPCVSLHQSQHKQGLVCACSSSVWGPGGGGSSWSCADRLTRVLDVEDTEDHGWWKGLSLEGVKDLHLSLGSTNAGQTFWHTLRVLTHHQLRKKNKNSAGSSIESTELGQI